LPVEILRFAQDDSGESLEPLPKPMTQPPKPMTQTRRPTRSARGLSTLEMVLCLPILMMVMALIINFGTVASWKVREWSVARHEAWSGRHPRSGATRPDYWPSQGGTMGAGRMTPLAWPDASALDQPVVRGPLPLGTVVHESVLDTSLGGRRGTASLVRDYPLLARLGPYRMNAAEEILEREWQHREMGLWSTFERRIPVLYQLAVVDPEFIEACVAVAVSIAYAPFRADLFPLDRDDEFIGYSRRFLDSLQFQSRYPLGAMAPEFHPDLVLPCGGACRDGCRTDPAFVQSRMEDLVDRIRGNPARGVRSLAHRMAAAFIRLYEDVQAELARRIAAEPPPAPADIAAMEREIDELQGKIDVLRAFQAKLN